MTRPSGSVHASEDRESPPLPISRESLREAARLARYLLPYRTRLIAALLALLLGSGMTLTFPYLAGQMVNAALSEPAPHHNVNVIALALLGTLALQAVCAFFRAIWTTEVAERSLADLRRDTYAHLLRLPLAVHARRRVGELSSRLATDLSQLQDALLGSLPQFLRQIVLLAGGVVLLLFTSIRLTMLMLASLPALIALAVFFGRFLQRNSREAQDRLADSSVIVEETLQGIATVKAFTNEDHEEQRYRHSLDAFLRVVMRGARYKGAFLGFVVFALFGAIVMVLWYGARLVQTRELSAGALTAFMLYTIFVGGAMGSFAELYSLLQRTLGATQRVRELLREPVEPVQGGARWQSVAGEERMPTCSTALHLRGDVIFDRVAFRYPSRPEVEVLREVSLEARAGQRIALVGPSGAGKSTLVGLLLRFYEPDSGCILLDGCDARGLDLHDLRGQMAIVPQDVLLFGGTLSENIAYGRPGAGENEIVEAARRANAHDFIATFPEGYQTRVGERGVQLSGGQRQRVAIARALLRDPAILILDEATSSLDSESESLVLQALDRLMEGRTSLVIAHRLSTVRRADRIFVLEAGRIVEAGTHDELVAREHGVYKMLAELQFAHPASPALDVKENAWPSNPPSPNPLPPLPRPS